MSGSGGFRFGSGGGKDGGFEDGGFGSGGGVFEGGLEGRGGSVDSFGGGGASSHSVETKYGSPSHVPRSITFVPCASSWKRAHFTASEAAARSSILMLTRRACDVSAPS